MLDITLISVSHKQPAWVHAAYEDYIKRLPSKLFRWQFKEIKPEAREGKSVAQAMLLEAKKISLCLPKDAFVVALDERGQAPSSQEFSVLLASWQALARPVVLVIGGADGLDAQFKKQCHVLLRLSSLTMPHGLVRVVLAEQIYRAHTILAQHPYHRT